MSALDPSKRVFIDESGFDTRMTRRFGRAARGVPCVGAVPHGHWRNTTFIAGLRNDRIDAPMLIEGAMDGEAFCAWVERMLAPTLSTGDIVRRGNDPRSAGKRATGAFPCPPHRFLIRLTLRQSQRPQERAGARRHRVLRRRAVLSARLFARPHPGLRPFRDELILRINSRTPFSPIEMVFAKIKTLVRSAAARCADTLGAAIASALTDIPPKSCARYLRHAGYAPTCARYSRLRTH